MDIVRHKHFFFQCQIEESSHNSCVYTCASIIFSIGWKLLNTGDSATEISMTTRKEGKKLSVIHLLPENYEYIDLKNVNPVDFVLNYWCKNCDVSKMELATVILFVSLVYCNDNENLKKIVENCNNSLLQYDRETVHSLSNFQAILYFTNFLIKLQDSIHENILPMKYWSGFNMYSIIHGFKTIGILQCKITETYSDKISEKFSELIQKFEPLCSQRLNVIDQPKRRRQKRTAKTNVKNCSSDNEYNLTDNTENNICDLNNRFNMLELSNNDE